MHPMKTSDLGEKVQCLPLGEVPRHEEGMAEDPLSGRPLLGVLHQALLHKQMEVRRPFRLVLQCRRLVTTLQNDEKMFFRSAKFSDILHHPTLGLPWRTGKVLIKGR